MSTRLSQNRAYQAIYEVVAAIPRGRVTTYGRVARMAGLPGHARQVGYALHALPGGCGLPWHRVVNASGMISRRADPDGGLMQKHLLESEGIAFDERGCISLSAFGWGEE